ncbi:GTP-binding protein [Demequina pelophila]|uniref:GTP-binding protein n=1 Tax=Demequina pelophila TaxID=1638984 RepID=UPI000785585E|nr:GTP-binding protein [Demequina pelophila]
MSVSFDMVGPSDDAAALAARVERLRSSLEWAREAIPAGIREELVAAIDRCDERLRLGIDFTVVALAGGTGSGKSSLFNAITGGSFAVAGAARPTTSEVSAAVWGPDPAEPLLDWLEIGRGHRHHLAQTELDDDFTRLRGLVLLDLPDHDSVDPANRALVDRIAPRVDLLLWVMDPQKYADDAIHTQYLESAAETGHPSLVVLNHVDRLSTEDAWEVVRDLQRLLSLDGLHEVPVLPASARTGQGVDVLRAELEGAVQARTVAADAVASDLVDAGRTLERALSRDAEPVLPDVRELVDSLAAAAGVDARAEAVGAVVAGRSHAIPDLPPMRVEVAERERLDWVDAASEGLPVTWRIVIAEAVAPGPRLAEEITSALATVGWPSAEKHPTWWGRRAAASRASQATREAGREAIARVVAPLLVEPTELIHQAYRNLDELTVYARAQKPVSPGADAPASA